MADAMKEWGIKGPRVGMSGGMYGVKGGEVVLRLGRNGV